jgi:hypothetical protein
MPVFEQQLREAPYLAMGGQIVDATLVPTTKKRNTEDVKAVIKADKSAEDIWRGKPHNARQRDVDAGWTIKIDGKVRYRSYVTPQPPIATPVFGHKSDISNDRRFGDPLWRRVCLRAAEEPLRPVHPHHRHCPRAAQNHPDQTRLELRPSDPPRTVRSHEIGPPEIRRKERKTHKNERTKDNLPA